MEQLTPAQRGSRAAIAGLLFAVLYVIAFLVLQRLPDGKTSASAAEEFYNSSGDRRAVTIVVVYVVPLTGIALLWFTAAVRHRVVNLAAGEDALLSTVQLLSAAVYVTMAFVATAVLTAPSIAVDLGAASVDEVVRDRSLLVVGDTILAVFALRSAGVFMAAGTTRALRSGLIPRWFAVVSYALVVVLLLVVSRARAVSLLFPLWVGVMSVIVLVRRIAPGATGAARGPA
jgi:hypothetical protein